MEAAAPFAGAHFQAVTLGQIMCCGDDLSGPGWDSRGRARKAEVRSQLLRRAVAACLAL